jgi:enediyne biosynthesis protein E3
VLTPGDSATRLSVRGFPEKDEATRELLESVGRSFLRGYGFAVQARSPRDAEPSLEEMPMLLRGFAYEGAAMGLAMLDGLSLRGGRVAEFLDGRAARHVYMAYVGVGWAMARLPRFRWPKLTAVDPLLSWLVLDGYGFHQAYFKTQRYVVNQYREQAFPWPGGVHRWYANRVIDQGIGRALWFVGGADPAAVIKLVGSFPASRRPDLYSGLGLATTYAGGGNEKELRFLWDSAGPCRAQLAQGCAFAAKARVLADLMVPHVELASEVFCGMTPAEAARITDIALPNSGDDRQLPAYERWRQGVAEELAVAGRST